MPDVFATNTLELRVEAIRQHVTIFELFEKMGVDVTPETQQMRCPFHADRNPSARVYAEQNKIYCFTCQKSWDVIEAAIDHYHLSFPDAVIWLEQEFAVPGGTSGLVGTIRTQLASRVAPDIRQVADSVEQVLKSTRKTMGFTRYAKCLQALDLTVYEAAEKKIKQDEVMQRMTAILQAARRP